MTQRILLNRGYYALVDDEDYERVIHEGKWYAVRGKRKHTHYARRSVPGGIGMHNFITGWTGVDHIDGDGLNNQRSNLRQATAGQNNANRGPNRASKTGFKGVTLRSDCTRRPWAARIQFERRPKYIGNFDSRHEAAVAYDRAARMLFGEYAWLNFPGGDASELSADAHTLVCAALSAAYSGDASAANRLVANIDDEDTITVAIRAAAELAIMLRRRGERLRELALPRRAATVCAWCGDPDCTERFDHDRLNSGRETTWRERAQR